MSPTLLLVIGCFGGLTAVQWIPEEQFKTTTEVCLGSNVNLGWNFTTEQGEVLKDIKWFFTPIGSSASDNIAVYNNEILQAFTSIGTRLDHQGNGVIALSRVTLDDAGEYMVEVIARKTTGSFSTIGRTVTLAVIDPAVYRSNQLTLQIAKIPEHDDSRTLHLLLACGPLPRPGESRARVIMKTPSGAEQTSFQFLNGIFRLVLTGSPQQGNYTCRLAPSSHDALCLKYGDPILEDASVYFGADVDHPILLDKVEIVQPPNRYSRDQPQQLEQCCDKFSNGIYFNVRLGTTVNVSSPDNIKFSYDMLNQGDAYDRDTGKFTAPLDGSYFFIVTVSPSDKGRKADSKLVVDCTPVAWTRTKSINFYDPGTMHAAVKLTAGAKVWVEAWGRDNQFDHLISLFSGFLIRPDL